MPRAERRAASRRAAAIFAALGDPTRLRLVDALSDGRPRSIAELARLAPISRQGLTKHLMTLKRAGVVASARRGRENRFVVRPKAVSDARVYLDRVARQWDDALLRLKNFVEE